MARHTCFTIGLHPGWLWPALADVMDLAEIEAALLAAHAAEDLEKLVALYVRAADLHEAAQDADAAGFYLTHAFVYALELGLPEAKHLNRRLAEQGRADLLTF